MPISSCREEKERQQGSQAGDSKADVAPPSRLAAEYDEDMQVVERAGLLQIST
jgi:hypothetical protein